MAVTIVDTCAEERAITGGVDTHADVHVAAALDPIGGCSASGSSLLRRLRCRLLGAGEFGTVCLAGIEGPAVTALAWPGTCSRRRPGRGSGPVRPPDRRLQASPTPLDAVSAARPPSPAGPRRAEGRDGAVEAIRALMVAKRSAIGERTRTINQARP